MATHEMELYALIEQYNFEQLNSQQKNLVLSTASQLEYTQLRKAYLLANAVNPITKKEAILAHIESKLPSPKQRYVGKIWQKPIPIWQMLALVLLSQLAWLPRWQQGTEKPILALVKDTLWKEIIVEKKIKTYDTVYLSYTQPTARQQTHKKATPTAKHSSTQLPVKSNPSISGAGGVNDARNRLFGRSLQQETPPLNLTFVAL